MNNRQLKFQKQLLSPLYFFLFKLTKLPLALLVGLRLKSLTLQKAEVTVKYKNLNKNPFGSIYFAVLEMGAELSTGVLCLLAIQEFSEPVSFLVVGNSSKFHKKAKGKITFVCEMELSGFMKEVIESGEGKTLELPVQAFDESGDMVSEHTFIWSFKRK